MDTVKTSTNVDKNIERIVYEVKKVSPFFKKQFKNINYFSKEKDSKLLTVVWDNSMNALLLESNNDLSNGKVLHYLDELTMNYGRRDLDWNKIKLNMKNKDKEFLLEIITTALENFKTNTNDSSNVLTFDFN